MSSIYLTLSYSKLDDLGRLNKEAKEEKGKHCCYCTLGQLSTVKIVLLC